VSKLREIIIILSFLAGATIILSHTKYPKTLTLINKIITTILILWLTILKN